MRVTILAIESSCDDTSVAVVRDGYVLSNLIAGQDIHMSYGGVVPELASRAHQANIVPGNGTLLSEKQELCMELRVPWLLMGIWIAVCHFLVSTSLEKGFAWQQSIP